MEIITEKELRAVSDLSFCYLCGEQFKGGECRTRDHVPARAIFLPEDRKCPLILPTHDACNQSQSKTDEVVGQIVSALHSKYPKRENIKLNLTVHKEAGWSVPMLILEGLNLQGVLARWIRAFHAALYKEYLPNNTPNVFEPPVPSGRKEKGKVVFDKLKIHFPLFVEVIKKNRKAGKIDRVVCFNEKCVYECVWETMDNGTWACFFALNIYDWKKLGDATYFPKRGCVGWYSPKTGCPQNATKGIVRILEIPISNVDSLDPFGN